MSDRADTNEDHAHARRYNSFLLRCWHMGEGKLHIKLQHTQSGNSAQVETYETEVGWLSKYCAPEAPEHRFPGSRAGLVDNAPRKCRRSDSVWKLAWSLRPYPKTLV